MLANYQKILKLSRYNLIILLSSLLLMFNSFIGLSYAQTNKISDGEELSRYFYGCFSPPKEAEGQSFTFHFSLKTDGTINGKPYIFWLSLHDDPKLRAALEPLLIKSLNKCTPVPLDEPFKGMIAGRVHILEFNLGSTSLFNQD